MKRKTVEFLIDQSEKKRLEVIKRLAQANSALNQAQHQMKTLEEYRARCKSTVSEGASSKSVPISKIKNTFAFVEKIDDAIDEQSNAVKIANVRVNRTKAQVQNIEKEVKKFDALLSRISQEESRLANKADQKLNDEFAARAFLRQKKQKLEETRA